MTTPPSDGNIVAAKSELSDAIHRLIDKQPVPIPRDTGWEPTFVDSPYMQLLESKGGQNVSAKGDSRQARLPIWVDAVDLLKEIDATAAVWKRDMPATALVDHRKHPATVARLQYLTLDTYRPQDTDKVTRWARQVREWVQRIVQLLDPEHIKHIAAPCPACAQDTVYRKDFAGEVVRQPALQLVTNRGCTCLACGASWGPELYLHLCRVLGFDLPEGVLE